MPHDRIEAALAIALSELSRTGTRKGRETVIAGMLPAQDVPASGGKGPRYRLADEGDRAFLRMNSNSYLGLGLHEQVIAAEEAAVRACGAGPGAVRFINGTWAPHIELEARLAAFHGRPAAMIFSSAYATVMGVLAPLITAETAVISDALNHNSIINALRLSRPGRKEIYRHLDMAELDARLEACAADCTRAIVITDGIFSMRGDHAPLDRIVEIARKHDG
ncbi:MAG: aminotransferase class I/II-fold pyridoxal phosphate-dependent enzyme, partial [Alphaproteobacteria bacterium]